MHLRGVCIVRALRSFTVVFDYAILFSNYCVGRWRASNSLCAERPPEDIILKVQIMSSYIFSGYNCYVKMREDIYADILVLKEKGL